MATNHTSGLLEIYCKGSVGSFDAYLALASMGKLSSMMYFAWVIPKQAVLRVPATAGTAGASSLAVAGC